MPQSKQEIQSILASAGSRPRHRFGQNFMIDQNLVRVIAAAGEVCPGDRVIEVGPGTGTLTDELLARGGLVTAVEIDRDLVAALRQRFADDERVQIVEADALDGKHALHPELLELARAGAKSVANLPYNIASPLVVEMLIAGARLLAFTVQREVADRMRATAGDDAYGPLSVMTQLLGRVEVLRTLPPQAFWPAPKIDSALVRIIRRDKSELPRGDEPSLRAVGVFIHGVFAYRRKTLRKALSEAGIDANRVIDRTQFDGSRRPETFTPGQFLAMFDAAGE